MTTAYRRMILLRFAVNQIPKIVRRHRSARLKGDRNLVNALTRRGLHPSHQNNSSALEDSSNSVNFGPRMLYQFRVKPSFGRLKTSHGSCSPYSFCRSAFPRSALKCSAHPKSESAWKILRLNRGTLTSSDSAILNLSTLAR